MLNVNNNGSIFNNSDSPADPTDPNSPVIPSPDTPVNTSTVDTDSPPSEMELKALTGGSLGGVAEELSEETIRQLAEHGISMESVREFAVRHAVNLGIAAGALIIRFAQDRLNRAIGGMFGGGSGGGKPPTALVFLPANDSDGGSGPGGGGPSGPSGPGSGPMYTHPVIHNHLDNNPKPGEVVLNVGLSVRAYVPYFKEYSANYTSPLHITCCYPEIPTDEAYVVGKFNSRSILLRFIERVSRSINYQLSPTTFTIANVSAYFNLILKGLAYYYWYESIYAYSMLPTNDTNDALIALRRNISAETLNSLAILRSTLSSLPIPPNMVLFVYYMYQNWQVTSLADSPVIKMCPFPIDVNTGLPMTTDPTSSPSATYLDAITSSLTSDTNRGITSTLVKAFDEWYKLQIPSSSLVLEHNADFTTLWSNLPHIYVQTGTNPVTHRQPAITSDTSAAPYQTFSDELDGAIPACLCVWDAARSKWAPSFIKPVDLIQGTLTNNRFSWTGPTTKFLQVYDKPAIAFQRPEMVRVTPPLTGYSVTLGGESVVHHPFAERLYGINVNTISEMSMEHMMWLFNFDNLSVTSGSAGKVLPSSPRGRALSEDTGSSPKTSRSSGNRWAKSKSKPKNLSGDSEAAADQRGEL